MLIGAYSGHAYARWEYHDCQNNHRGLWPTSHWSSGSRQDYVVPALQAGSASAGGRCMPIQPCKII